MFAAHYSFKSFIRRLSSAVISRKILFIESKKAGIDAQKFMAGEHFFHRLGPKTILFSIRQKHISENSPPHSEITAKNS
jgi:hypothetical protein